MFLFTMWDLDTRAQTIIVKLKRRWPQARIQNKDETHIWNEINNKTNSLKNGPPQKTRRRVENERDSFPFNEKRNKGKRHRNCARTAKGDDMAGKRDCRGKMAAIDTPRISVLRVVSIDDSQRGGLRKIEADERHKRDLAN